MRIVFVYLLSLAAICASQTDINGLIQDAQSGQPIPSANVQIQAALRGAVSNLDGRFHLLPENWPATLRISHIGYQSQLVTLNAAPIKPIVISLQPSVIKMPDMVITAQDPAINIMRKAIDAKRKQREQLHCFAANAYTRMRAENDSAVVMISESTSRLYWHRDKGIAEKMLSRVQSLNLEKGMTGPQAGQLPNLSDDNVSQYGFTLIGPTHPDALDYYNFKLENRRSQDGRVVYDISVTPKTRLQPCFSGSISILDEAYALLEADLTACNIRPQEFYLHKIEFTCRQQYSCFNSLYWLPVASQQRDEILFGIPGLQFPNIKLVRLSSLDHYEINPQIPDSVFQKRLLRAGSKETSKDSILTFRHRQVPLTMEEEQAYKTIDSTLTILKGFQPKGYLARFVKVETKSDTSRSGEVTAKMPMSYSPIVGFNRVDGLQTGLGCKLAPFHSELSLQGRYHWSSKKWAFAAEWRYRTKGKNPWQLGVGFQDQSRPIGVYSIYPQLATAVAALVGKPDYFNYYWNQAYSTSLGRQWRRHHIGVIVELSSSQQTLLTKHTDYSILNKTVNKRENPAINPGRLNSVSMRFNWGELANTFGTVGQTGLTLQIEHSAPGIGSDFAFTRFSGRMDLHLKTWYARYLFPNSLDICILAGDRIGKLPVQSLGILDSRLLALAPFAAFKTLADEPFYGDRYVALHAEHNFRGMPWQWLGLTRLADKGVHILLHGGVGRTWLDERAVLLPELNQWHAEAGLAVNGILTYLRCDFSMRLTGNRAFFITLAPRKLF